MLLAAQSLWQARRERRARLGTLLALLRAGDVAFRVQCENRDRLYELLKQRLPDLVATAGSYDRAFAAAYRSLTDEERELFAVVRAITVHTLHPLNESLLLWLAADTDFKVRPSGRGPRGELAGFLARLEAHLLLWRAKYETWIPHNMDRALVYLADEKRHGLGFPQGGTALVSRLLGHRPDRSD